MRKLLIYGSMFIGAILQGVAMALFLFPHSIPSGGAAGIALLLHHWTGLSLGFSLWMANAVFLLFAVNYFGYTWTFRTVLSVATTSLTVNFVTSHLLIEPFPLAFSMVAGSVLFGIGVGLLIRAGSSSGGMVIPALMLAYYKNWSPGKSLMLINFSIFIITSLVIDYIIVIYAVICQLLSTRLIDYLYQLKFGKFYRLAWSWRHK